MTSARDQQNTKNVTPVPPQVPQNVASVPPQVISATPSLSKEQAPAKINTGEILKEASFEVELPKEVKEAGVEKIGGKVELPPDIKKLGVTPLGSATPINPQVQLPQVTLPISDSQVLGGLHQNVKEAILWLALWCLKKLKKAHVGLKVIHGKIMRIKI